jgi:GT2 family glycosyltransferase
MLERTIGKLTDQTYATVRVWVVDDGSTDGTADYLATLPENAVTILTGNGSLWWGGAVAKAMSEIAAGAADSDYILLLNDDVEFSKNYVAEMVETSRKERHAVVVSPQFDQVSQELQYTGYRINHWWLRIEATKGDRIDATVGRGLLVPVHAIRGAGIVDAKRFPHYMGDIEYTARLVRCGSALRVAWNAPIYSDHTPSDQHVQQRGLLARYFHNRSKNNLWSRLRFFLLYGSPFERATAGPRLAMKYAIKAVRRVLRVLSRGNSNVT